jgi:hypothetical protein
MKTARKNVPEAANPRQAHNERVKDEVYRQMFRLEEGCVGAETGLAVALLHAWLVADAESASGEARAWLKKISPICLELIDGSFKTSCPARCCED